MSKAFLMQEESSLRNIFIPNELLQSFKANSNQNMALRSVSDGAHVTLSTVEAQKLQMGQDFASVKQITDSCWAIRNTLFTPVTPKPDWYDGLNGKFNVVKKFANEWIDDISIGVTSIIPSSVMDFVPTFTACSNAITAITQHTPGDLSQSELISVREILTRIVTKVDQISDKVNYYAKEENGIVTGKLVDWRKKMSDAGLELKSGSNNIQNAASNLTSEIQRYNRDIDALKLDIKHYNNLVATGAGLVGGGVFVGAVGGALCFAFPVIGGIVIALGVGMVIGGAVTWGVYQKKINEANAKIEDYQKKIRADEQTLLAINSLSTGVDLAMSSAENAVKNITDFAASWLCFGNSLKGTLAALEQGGRESKGALIDLDLDTSARNWTEVKAYAQGLLNVPTGVKQVPASYVA